MAWSAEVRPQQSPLSQGTGTLSRPKFHPEGPQEEDIHGAGGDSGRDLQGDTQNPQAILGTRREGSSPKRVAKSPWLGCGGTGLTYSKCSCKDRDGENETEEGAGRV